MGNNQEKIDSYLRHEFNEDEEEGFEKSIKFDRNLNTDFELTKLISKSLSKRAFLSKQMSRWEAELEQKESTNFFSRHFKKIIIVGTGLAASIIIGFLIIAPFYNSDMTESKEKYAYRLPYFDSTDYLANDYRIYTSQIDSLINIVEYDKALSMICLIEKDFETFKPYANIEFVEAGLEGSEISGNTNYQNDAYVLRWRKINVLLALGEIDDALNVLNEFKDEDGKFKEKAQKLYKKLMESEDFE